MENFRNGVWTRILAAALLVALVSSGTCFAEVNSCLMADYLFEIGKRFYSQGNYEQAVHEFKKGLLVSPGHKQIIEYMRLIEEKESRAKPSPIPAVPAKEIVPARPEPAYIAVPGVKVKLVPTTPEVTVSAGGLPGEEKPGAAARHKKEIVTSYPKKAAVKAGTQKAAAPAPQSVSLPSYETEGAISYPEVSATARPKITALPQVKSRPPADSKGLSELVREEIGSRVASRPATAGKAAVAQEETEPQAKPVSAQPVHRKGDIGLFINGKEVETAKPLAVRDGRVFLPLEEIASALSYGVVSLGGEKFKVISPEGIVKEVAIPLSEGQPLVSHDKLKEYFAAEANYSTSGKALYVTTASAGQFKTYMLERPEAEIREEKQMRQMVHEATSVPEIPASIPPSAQPSVQLRGNVSYTYLDYHVQPTYHSMISSFVGRAYDYNVAYESTRKDMNGLFDHDYTYLNLFKPGLFLGLFDQSVDLYPLRMQADSFTGVKVIRDWDNTHKTTVLGGSTDNYVAGGSGTVKYLGKVYGVKEEVAPLSWLGLKGAIYYLENSTDLPDQNGTTSFPRKNFVSYAESSLKLPYDVGISAQVARSDHEPDNARGTTLEDWDWRVATEMNKRRYRLGFAYEFVGDNYASFSNPAFYRDYEGWNLYGNYRASDSWMLSGSVLRYHDNVEHDPTKIRTDNLVYTLSSYYTLTRDQWLNFSFSRYYTNPEGLFSGAGSKANLYHADYSFPLPFGLRSMLNYQYYRSDATDGETDYYSHTTGGSIFKSFGRGSSWYLGQQFIKTQYETSQDNFSSNSYFNINYALNPLLSLYQNYSYDRTKTNESEAVDTVSESTGFRLLVTPETTLTVEHNVNTYNLKTEKGRWPKNWSILAYVSQNFSLSTPPNFGVIEGQVIRDSNGNGKAEAGEPGMADVTLYLEDRRETTTDAAGRYKFSYVAPGIQKVNIDLASVSTDWTLKDTKREVEVKAHRSNKADFFLLRACLIKGRVFIDANGNSRFEDNEEPLDSIGLTLMPGKQYRWTNSEGEYKFDYLLPGVYTLSINKQNIPSGYELVSKEEIQLKVKAGQEIGKVDFAVRLKPQAPKE